MQGRGRFFDDLKLADQLYAAIVRSPHAHADITGIDTGTALQMPGVHAVLTGADYRGDGLGSLPSMAPYKRRGGGPMFLPPRPAIAFDRVMRRQAARRGMLRGIGISNTIEQAADPTYETAEIRFDPLGGMTFVTGSISHGQGHATIQTQMLVDRLALILKDQVHRRRHRRGGVRYGHRRLALDHHERRRHRCGQRQDCRQGQEARRAFLEASEGDIEFKDGRFTIAGTDRAMGIHEVAKAAFQLDKLPAGMEPGLYETATYRARSSNFPNGCHVCEVEIDPETGSTQVIGYWVVDDVGTVINPMLVKGQIMGGIAQGLGQVLMEDKSYDETGQVLTGSLMDYAMPRADDFCAVVIEDNPVPTATNPLGVKGAGEAGTVGSLSAGVNAIVDALSVLGIKHIDTPCTPYRVWQAIANAWARVAKPRTS